MQDNSSRQKKVSVIVPLFNAEPYIERCLCSVVCQSHNNLEVIVVDDASTDASVKIVMKFMISHPCVRLIQHDTNQGSMLSRRDGYEAATGNFIMFVDADDTLPVDAVEKLVRMGKETNADIVAGTIEKIYVSGCKEYIRNELVQNATSEDIMEALLTLKLTHSLCGKLYKTSLIKNKELLNYDRMTISEDGCLFYQLAHIAQSITTSNEVVYFYYENEYSTSHQVYGTRQIENIILANKAIHDICKKYPALDFKLQQKMSRTIFPLYAECVPNKEIKRLLRKYGMARYGQINFVAHYLNYSDYIFFFKRFIRIRLLAFISKCKKK